MNYYIQGDAANADKIRAAFEGKGIYSACNFENENYLYYSCDGKVAFCFIGGGLANIIKTHPDYKELELPKPHYDIANFKPFDKVLVRCSNDEEWMIEFYCKYDTLVHTSPHRDYPFMGIGDSYSQCIPFEGNETLLGTTDMCDEQFINW